MSTALGGTTPPEGRSFVCRREVYDVLATADGVPAQVLGYEDLKSAVAVRLWKYLAKEIENSGGIDFYLRSRLETFTEASKEQKAMLEHDPVLDTYRLMPKFQLRVQYPDGGMENYTPRLALDLERLTYISEAIEALRRTVGKNHWDCLPPRSGADHLARSLRFGWLTGEAVVRDRTGFVIDGRVRAELADQARISLTPSQDLTIPRLDQARGVVVSYAKNRSRMTTSEQTKYEARFLSRVGTSMAELERMYLATEAWCTSRQKRKMFEVEDVEIPSLYGTVLVSTDRRYLQLRRLMELVGVNTYNVRVVVKHLEDSGYEVFKSSTDGTTASKWVQLADLVKCLDADPKPLWPRVDGLDERFRSVVREVRDVVAEGLEDVEVA